MQPDNDTFDIKAYNENKDQFSIRNYTLPNGISATQISTEDGGYAEYQSTKLGLVTVEKEYYGNGKIKERKYRIANLEAGIWEYFSKSGKKRTADKDKRYGKFSYDKVLQYLEKEGRISFMGKHNGTALFYDSIFNHWEAIINHNYMDDNIIRHHYFFDGNNGNLLTKWDFKPFHKELALDLSKNNKDSLLLDKGLIEKMGVGNRSESEDNSISLTYLNQYYAKKFIAFQEPYGKSYIYYTNGRIKEKRYFFRENTPIGIWEYYDINGNKKTVDKDRIYRTSPEEIKRFIESEKWIEKISDWERIDVYYNKNKKEWNINVSTDKIRPYNWRYIVNDNTGKVLSSRKIHILEEE